MLVPHGRFVFLGVLRFLYSLFKVLKMNFNNLVQQCCSMPYASIWRWLEDVHGFTIVNPDSDRDRYAYRPTTGVNVLTVCHADTVLNRPDLWEQEGDWIQSSELDDRLGLAMALAMSRRHGTAILVCDNEEVGRSTASVFAGDNWPVPNWLIEFDRRGTDAVTYDYSSECWDGICEHYFEEIGNGSFSDVCYLESMERKAVNVGVGYYREHSLKCHAYLDETRWRMNQVSRMLREVGGIPMLHKEKRASKIPTRLYYGSWDMDDETTHLMPALDGTTYRTECTGCETMHDMIDLEDVGSHVDLCRYCRALLGGVK